MAHGPSPDEYMYLAILEHLTFLEYSGNIRNGFLMTFCVDNIGLQDLPIDIGLCSFCYATFWSDKNNLRSTSSNIIEIGDRGISRYLTSHRDRRVLTETIRWFTNAALTEH